MLLEILMQISNLIFFPPFVRNIYLVFFVSFWVCSHFWIFSFNKEERYCEAVRSLQFDKNLGPYNLKQYSEWKQLSNYITKSTIERLGMY